MTTDQELSTIDKQLIATHFPEAGLVQLRETGLIGLLPGDIPLQEIATLIDSLLAAPVLVSVVRMNGRRAHYLLKELRQQSGQLMLVGALLQTLSSDEIDTARAAGAQFLIVPLILAKHCLTQQIPHIPLTPTLEHAAAAAQLGYRTVCAPLADAETAAHWHAHLPSLSLIAVSDPTPAELVELMHPQLTALAAPLWSDETQSMREIITKARRLTAAWQANIPPTQ